MCEDLSKLIPDHVLSHIAWTCKSHVISAAHTSEFAATVKSPAVHVAVQEVSKHFQGFRWWMILSSNKYRHSANSLLHIICMPWTCVCESACDKSMDFQNYHGWVIQIALSSWSHTYHIKVLKEQRANKDKKTLAPQTMQENKRYINQDSTHGELWIQRFLTRTSILCNGCAGTLLWWWRVTGDVWMWTQNVGCCSNLLLFSSIMLLSGSKEARSDISSVSHETEM